MTAKKKNEKEEKGQVAANAGEAKTATTEGTEDVIARAKRLREAAQEAAKAAREQREKDKAARKAEREAKAAERKQEKEAKAAKEPDLVEQENERGETELVDRNKNPHELVCPECGKIRWLTLSQTHEVTHCKPCARKLRRKRRIGRVRESHKNHRAIVEEAIKQGLFPQSFRDKWGI